MPEVLKLEAIALSQLWPKRFKLKPPDGQDIGLCFISSRQGPHRSFDHLLEKISSNIGLWTNIGDIELSVFSSKLLPPDYQRKDGKFYFWGVFGKRLRKNQHYHSNLSQPNEDSGDKSVDTVAKLHETEGRETEGAQPENGMRVDERCGKSKGIGSTTDVTRDNFVVIDKNMGANVLDVTRGNETDRVNECAGLLGTLNSYNASSCAAPAASLRNGCCSHATAKNSTLNVADSPCRPANIILSGSDLVVDYPPGVPPKTDRVNDRAAMLGTPDSNPASLITGCSRDTANKSTFSVEGLMLDKPPGFFLKSDRVDECTVALGTPDSNSASNVAATASLRHGSENKSTSSLEDFPCEPAKIASAASELMLDKPNGCDVVLGTPSSDPASSCTAPVDSLLSSCFGRDWNKSTFSLSDSLLKPADTSSAGPDPKLDTHPGFSLNAPPGFSKAHCQTQANDTPYVDAPRSLVIDTTDGFPNNIPPGFSEAHRQLPRITSTEPETGVSTPTKEKKPLIRFSLNVPRFVKTETLPGFTASNAAKKEPGSPAVEKATEKLTPSPLAFGSSSVRKAGKADGTRITSDEVITEDETSEEREFPKIRRLSELYSTPRSRNEVCRNLDDKFQATEEPEEHRHHGKRVMQEPPAESSLSDTAKRLKVNGRLALSNVINRQPNRDQENGSSTPSIGR